MMKANMVGAALVAVALGSGFASGPATAQARRGAPLASLPAAVQGVWFKGDADGRAQCAAYKRVANGRDSDEIWRSLILGSVITPRRMHAVAEYGEGNVYDVRSVSGNAKAGWMVTSILTLDGGDPEPGTVRFRLKSLAADKLQIMFIERGRSGATEVNFRCAPVSRFLLTQNR